MGGQGGFTSLVDEEQGCGVEREVEAAQRARLCLGRPRPRDAHTYFPAPSAKQQQTPVLSHIPGGYTMIMSRWGH